MSKLQDTADPSFFERAPYEIKTGILELLDGPDIKSLRLVKKALLPVCNDILFRHMRLVLICDALNPMALRLNRGNWPPPTAKLSATIRNFEAFASFRQKNIFRHVLSLEILSFTPDAVRGRDGNVTIEHKMGVPVPRGESGKNFYTDTAIGEFVNAMDSMTRLTSLYMHKDFLKYLEHGQLSLDFLANRVKSFKIVAELNNGFFPSPKFYSNLVTLEAHPVLLSKAKENGLVNLINLKNLVVYGGRPSDSGGIVSRSHDSTPPPETPRFDLNEFLAVQESPFALTSLSLKTLAQISAGEMIAFPEKIDSTLINPYLLNLRRLHIDYTPWDYNNTIAVPKTYNPNTSITSITSILKTASLGYLSDLRRLDIDFEPADPDKLNSEHIWNVFKANNIHLEDIRLAYISKQLLLYLGSYRDTLKSLQIGVQVRHPLGSRRIHPRAWAELQQLGSMFWRDVIPAHSSTLHTLRTKPEHNDYQRIKDEVQAKRLEEDYLPDSWSPVNNPAAHEAIEMCERLRDLAVFSIDDGSQPFEQLIWLMLKQPKLRRFTFYNDYCTEWNHNYGFRWNEFYSVADKLLQDVLGWRRNEDIGSIGGFRIRYPLEVELYPAGKLKTYFDRDCKAWMLVQVGFDRKELTEGEMELNLDEGEVERFFRLQPKPIRLTCRPHRGP